MINKPDLKDIKERIVMSELYNNGLKNINGAYAEVKSLRLNKDKSIATYTLILGNDLEGEKHTYKGVKFKLK